MAELAEEFTPFQLRNGRWVVTHAGTLAALLKAEGA